jgi:hypothetical protein
MWELKKKLILIRSKKIRKEFRRKYINGKILGKNGMWRKSD